MRRSASPTCASWPRRPNAAHWPTNLADDPRNLPYPNFGCAQQRNLAAQVANPADLLGPRTMEPADAERRDVVLDKYRQGQADGRREGRRRTRRRSRAPTNSRSYDEQASSHPPPSDRPRMAASWCPADGAERDGGRARASAADPAHLHPGLLRGRRDGRGAADRGRGPAARQGARQRAHGRRRGRRRALPARARRRT